MSKLLRTAMVAIVGLFAVALSASATQQNQQKDQGKDQGKTKLDGQYVITAGERNGQPIPEADLKGATFRITSNKLVAATKDGAEFLAADYTLDESKKPCAITLKLTAGSDKGKDMAGLVEHQGDTVRIIFAQPGGEKPTEFKTKQNQVMYTLKAAK